MEKTKIAAYGSSRPQTSLVGARVESLDHHTKQLNLTVAKGFQEEDNTDLEACSARKKVWKVASSMFRERAPPLLAPVTVAVLFVWSEHAKTPVRSSNEEL